MHYMRTTHNIKFLEFSSDFLAIMLVVKMITYIYNLRVFHRNKSINSSNCIAVYKCTFCKFLTFLLVDQTVYLK